MRNIKLSLFLLVVVVTQIFSIAFAESITLTTYYPAPFGAYDRLQLVPRSLLFGSCLPGTFYLDNIVGDMHFCLPDGTWGYLPGVWKQPNGSGSSVFLADPANPKIGIGTSTPAEHMHVSGSGVQKVLVESTAAQNTGIQLSNTNRSFSMQVDGGTGNLKVVDNTSAANRLTIANDGNVGIGSLTPQAPLDVNGGVKVGFMSNLECNPARQGTFRWAASDVQMHYCDGSVWQIISVQTLPATCVPATTWSGAYLGCSCGIPGGVLWEGSQVCTCELDGITWTCVPTCPAPPIPCPP